MGNHVTAYALLKNFLAGEGFEAVFREVPSNLSQAVPLLTVVRFGGVDTNIVIDRPSVQIDVFASSADTAEGLAEDIRTALHIRMPKHMYGGAVVGRVATMSGPQILPWSTSGVFRVGARYQLTVHQYSGIS